jgi:hypothetical protein
VQGAGVLARRARTPSRGLREPCSSLSWTTNRAIRPSDDVPAHRGGSAWPRAWGSLTLNGRSALHHWCQSSGIAMAAPSQRSRRARRTRRSPARRRAAARRAWRGRRSSYRAAAAAKARWVVRQDTRCSAATSATARLEPAIAFATGWLDPAVSRVGARRRAPCPRSRQARTWRLRVRGESALTASPKQPRCGIDG